MPSPQEYPYETHLNERYAPLQLVDVPALVATVQHPWYNQTLCRVNDAVLRLGVFEAGGEYHWHKHDDEDELFFVLDGCFVVDLEDKSVTLSAQQGFMVPRGTVHRTRSPERSVILMMEGASVIPTGD